MPMNMHWIEVHMCLPARGDPIIYIYIQIYILSMAFWHAVNGFVIGSLGLKSKLYFGWHIELLSDWMNCGCNTEIGSINSLPLTK